MIDHSDIRKRVIGPVKRVVLKLGSSVVTNDEGLDHQVIGNIVDEVCRCKELGKEFIIVSSGAIAAGVRRLNLREGARTIPQKQAAASVGQTRLMAAYEEAFGRHGIGVGQMLLTKDDLTHRSRYLNARNTLMTLLSWDAVPIINENDTVVVQEIRFGDNDNLSALVATVADADLLLVLSDIEGFMDCDPRTNPDACLIPLVEDVTPEVKGLATGPSSKVGRGGMASKLAAAEIVTIAGIPMVIAKGKVPGIISCVLDAEVCGTLILPAKETIPARKHWIRYNLEPEGELEVDSGAAAAISCNGKSLLPIGVTAVRGTFEHGAKVEVCNHTGKKLAAGLVNYSSEELEKIMGRQTVEISWLLGYRNTEEAIHADNLVLLDQ
jgi:glutamate 5-kinase